MAEGLVDYRPGHVVERFEPAGSGVVVHAREAGGNAVAIEAKRVFVGAGVIPSAWLALNSLGAFDEPVTMLDSQYFISPSSASSARRGLTKSHSPRWCRRSWKLTIRV